MLRLLLLLLVFALAQAKRSAPNWLGGPSKNELPHSFWNTPTFSLAAAVYTPSAAWSTAAAASVVRQREQHRPPLSAVAEAAAAGAAAAAQQPA